MKKSLINFLAIKPVKYFVLTLIYSDSKFVFEIASLLRGKGGVFYQSFGYDIRPESHCNKSV